MMRVVLVCFLTLGLWGCDASGEKSMRLVLPDMAHSVPYGGYDSHPLFGQTLRLPPEGTVPMGRLLPNFSVGAEEAQRAGRELKNPIAEADVDLPRGKKVYDTFCLVCHGAGGEGDGPIIGRFPNPPSLLAPRARELPDGHLYHVMTYGQGLMAAYAVQVLPEDRWQIIHYIRWLQSTTPGVGAPKEEPSVAAEGPEGEGESQGTAADTPGTPEEASSKEASPDVGAKEGEEP